MNTPKAEQGGDLQVERFTPVMHEGVSALLMKFAERPPRDDPLTKELGLTFKSTLEQRRVDEIVAEVFTENPELEEDREAMDAAWWDNFTEEQKKEYEDDEEFLEGRKQISRYRTVLASPFASKIHQETVKDHLKNTDTQTQLVVVRQSAVLGYLAVWNGASTLYLDDHMQVDAKVVDLDLDADTQRTVVAEFEPELYELSLP